MKTACFSFDEHISYMNGQLDNKSQLAFESHLSQCDQCLKKLIESYELIQDPTIDRQTEVFSMPDVSKIKRWIEEQVSGIFSWRPQCHVWGMFSPVLQTVRYRNEQNLVEKDCSAIKVMHNQYPANLWFQKQNNKFKLWIQIQDLDSGKKPVLITLMGENQFENSQNISNEPVAFEQVPFGQYSIVVETMDDEVTIIQFKIDPQQIKRLSP